MKDKLIAKLASLKLETPHLVYMEDIIEKNVEHIKRSNSLGIDLSIFYSVKACYHPKILEIMKKNGLGFEVMSEMELDIVLGIEKESNKIITNGIGRSVSYLERSYLNDHVIIIDSLGDLAKLDVLTKLHQKCCAIGIRINTGNPCDSSKSKFIFSKLGIVPFSDEYFAILDKIASNQYFLLRFIHTHSSINESNIHIYRDSLNDIAQVYSNMKEKYKIDSVVTIDIGGGFASNSNLKNINVNFEEIFNAFYEEFPNLKCAIEPGRNLINNAGFMITKVTDVKKKAGKYYVFVDATTNVLIPIPTAQYDILYPATSEVGFECSLADGVLSPNNIIIDRFFLKKIPSIGDAVVISSCGAYTSSMGASWGFDLIPVSLLKCNDDLVPILTNEAIKKSKMALIN